MSTDNPSFHQYPIDFILKHIGIDFSVFDGRVLDLGCGKDARLVKHLRGLGIAAEGLDGEIESDKRYLMRADASSIPRPDSYYDVICSHMSVFRQGHKSLREFAVEFTSAEEDDKNYELFKVPMLGALKDSVRVLKPGRDIVIWPAPIFFLDDIAASLPELGLSQKTVEIPNYDSIAQVLKATYEGQIFHSFVDDIKYRSVLTKTARM